MTVSFTFRNGTSQIHLLPQDQREKDLIRLWRDEVGELKIAATAGAPETLIIESEKRKAEG